MSLISHKRDQLFLKACYEEDREALARWNVESYHTEVLEAMKAAADQVRPSRLNRELVTSLVVACTAAIYEDHANLPSVLYGLKARVRSVAFAYMKKYLSAARQHQR
jgi:hypothetical protein